MNGAFILETQLKDYCRNGLYPMHMPGHKRILAPAPGLPFAWDLTEVEGVDDLHHPEGILKDAMERTAELWGSRRSWFLVNGSTCGILASIYAAVSLGDEVIFARNCHKSVFHAAELLDLHVHWLMPEYDPDWEIFGKVPPAGVQELLEEYPGTKAVVVTSPTYEGIVSDIRSIADICHAAGVPLIVDEAHGAHFGLFPEGCFPESALHEGADLVVQSAHKTLPSLTQTAFLHMGEYSIIREEAVEHALDVFETSSPSYPLMVSLDGCTGILREQGASLFAYWRMGIRKLEKAAGSLENIEIFMHDGKGECADYDDSRFLLRAKKQFWLSGEKLAAILRTECGLESEMHCGRNVLLMTGAGDSGVGYGRAKAGLQRLNQILAGEIPCPVMQEAEAGNSQDMWTEEGTAAECIAADSAPHLITEIETACSIANAERILREGNGEKVSLLQASGRVCAEYVTAYPPGVPVLIPGEKITDGAIRVILYLIQQGAGMRWSTGGNRGNQNVITVLKQVQDRD